MPDEIMTEEELVERLKSAREYVESGQLAQDVQTIQSGTETISKSIAESFALVVDAAEGLFAELATIISESFGRGNTPPQD